MMCWRPSKPEEMGSHVQWVSPEKSKAPWGSREGMPNNGEDGLRWEEGWRCSELQQWPISPQPAADVSHLLSMLTAGLRTSIPCIKTLNGDATLGKTEVSCEQW